MSTITTDKNDPRLGYGSDETPRPQNEVYLVLSEEERAKGFVRPYRDSYRHVGERPMYPLHDLSEAQNERYSAFGYVKYEQYPRGAHGAIMGRYWTQQQLDAKGCNTVTTMSRSLSETYAANPRFYGSTYCVGCYMHRPVAEFVWTADGQQVGS